MVKSRSSRGMQLLSNLPALQNLIKRDPHGYKSEFISQWTHYSTLRELLVSSSLSSSSPETDNFPGLIAFLAQTCPLYEKQSKLFPLQCAEMLLQNPSLPTEIKKSLISALILLRTKNAVSPSELLATLFPLLGSSTSSTIRGLIRKTILTEIKVANQKAKAHALNRQVLGLLFAVIERGMDSDQSLSNNRKATVTGTKEENEAVWAVMLVRELWRKQIWTDAKTVSLVALACMHPSAKVQSASVHFFLGSENADAEDSSESEPEVDVRKVLHQRTINKTRRGTDKKTAQISKALTKKRRDKQNKRMDEKVNFSALQLLHDPQTFAERLFLNLSKFDKRHVLDHKVLIMQLLSQVMGAHKLCVLSFYSYIIKYLTYHQLRITLILVSLAQSVHELTPPDVLQPVITKLAHEFVHPGVAAEVIAAGINAIREICRRQPWCMEQGLLEDLIEYRKSADKGVTTAARGLLQLFREVNPGLLKRSERGKAASLASAKKPLEFGHVKENTGGVDGLELLEAQLAEKNEAEGENMEKDEDEFAGWDVEDSDDSDEESDNGWIDVESDGDDDLVIDVSEDETDKPVNPLKRSVDDEETPGIAKKQKIAGQKTIGKRRSTAETDRLKDQAEQEALTIEAARLAAEKQAAEDAKATESHIPLAQTKILTPADFALLTDLRIKALTQESKTGSATNAGKQKLASLHEAKKIIAAANVEDNSTSALSESDIIGKRKKAKMNYEERLAGIQEGREGREKYGSKKGKKNKEKESSSTNRQKARNKPLMMAIHSSAVVSKKKASLRDKQTQLRKHVVKMKMKKK